MIFHILMPVRLLKNHWPTDREWRKRASCNLKKSNNSDLNSVINNEEHTYPANYHVFVDKGKIVKSKISNLLLLCQVMNMLEFGYHFSGSNQAILFGTDEDETRPKTAKSPFKAKIIRCWYQEPMKWNSGLPFFDLLLLKYAHLFTWCYLRDDILCRRFFELKMKLRISCDSNKVVSRN